MRASAIEFRLRMWINAAIIILGFWAPWIEAWRIGHRVSLVEWLALELSRSGALSFGAGIAAVILLGAVFALAGAVFRISGTAYLGPGTVNNVNMLAGNVMADGPYRFVRNPLYIGLWCMVAAMAILMPVTGALFAMLLITIFMVRLTLGEEAFLGAQLGEAYAAYLRAVPRFIPRLRGALPAAGAEPHWLRAALAELTPIGVFVGIAVYSRNYDPALAGRLILIFFGASLLVRAFLPGAIKAE
jgi:protein-S-isoprenylcysteine O-methyltransferase Ste14